ncbi:PREDICTED: uncharacterized protein LOC109153859 isoform X2 [Ipomoea nil]|uniref:uncharacterized protein LOC109153859 isoform X2 n=1 Tax=Ipomoea nil TaxID=35883 RepID=UPI0009017750|nr:PREDICTED: uncharacterized protein LOC109153859 isoform X2 [Ipomoea nil]
MAVLSPLLSSSSLQYTFPSLSSLSPKPTLTLAPYRYRSRVILSQVSHHHQPPPPPVVIDRSLLNVSEAKSESELWAAASLRVQTFYVTHNDSINIEEHKKYLAEREFEALKERIAGKRLGFGRVSCINATVPLSQVSSVSHDLCTSYKGIGADFARAYLSNVCVAKELRRNGLGYALIAQARMVAEEWGMSDLYVHVAIDNEPALNLYKKCGFVYESEEPAWQARFLDRPRRLLLWMGLPVSYDL